MTILALCALSAAPVSAGALRSRAVPPASAPRPPGAMTQAAYPSHASIRAAQRYIAKRAGRKAFAVMDDKRRLTGFRIDSRFHSASVVKSMLLVAYLRKLGAEHRGLNEEAKSLLYPMIHSSDNEAASEVLERVGERALNGVARAARMRDYVPGERPGASRRSRRGTWRVSSSTRTS